MSEEYTPQKVWKWQQDATGKFANINRPVSGALVERELPQGEHALQLHSLATPNGVKVTIMLEELLELGIAEADYDAWPVDIMQGDQFTSGFVEVNPNSKIPALIDYSTPIATTLFESGSILLYLAEKFGHFLPGSGQARSQTFNWLFWQMGSAPYVGGGFGHFYAYAPEKIKYCIDRFTMETKRQLDVLDKRLQQVEYLNGESYSIADMAVFPWYGALVLGELYAAAEFLDVEIYKNLTAWAQKLARRKATQRGRLVNRTWGEEQLPERHSRSDFQQFNL